MTIYMYINCRYKAIRLFKQQRKATHLPSSLSPCPLLSPLLLLVLGSLASLAHNRLENYTYCNPGMTKVYPNATSPAPTVPDKAAPSDACEAVLTVWKKSLLFNCNGFTVFDGKGNLVFRVDNYMEGNKGEIVLMDDAGNPLLTIRKKKLSLGDSWLVYDGETDVNPRFSARKKVNILNTKCLAHVSFPSTCSNSSNKGMMYEIQGSYAQRACAVYDGKRRKVAEVRRKETVGGVSFGVDVFRLIVQPEIDTAVAMALVILLEQMFGTSRRFSPF